MSETPETLGNLLRSRATHAKNTCEAKRQISRVDAVCWFLSQVHMASAREVKRFVTAFKGRMSRYSHYDRRAKKHGVREGFEQCYALLNTAYGGVGMDVLGTQRTCYTGSHYGPVAPLYRPQPRHYSITVAGARRAERVAAFLTA
jgi:hypothetical protein